MLQGLFDGYLSSGLTARKIPGAEHTEPARLATGVFVGTPTRAYRQFSAIGPLLKINEDQNDLARKDPPAGRPIMIATDVVVERFEVESADNGKLHARVLHTSRGSLNLQSGKTKVILAAGPIPTTTILMNSIGDQLQGRAGRRFTAHFRSNIKARFRPSQAWLKSQSLPSHPVIAACHVRGRGTKRLQWHIQVNGIHTPAPVVEEGQNMSFTKLMEFAQADSVQFASLAPDYEAALTAEEWLGSQGYIVVCTSWTLNRFTMQS